MSDARPPDRPPIRDEYVRARGGMGEDMLWTLISAGLFLYVGFGWGLSPTSDAAPLYALSVHAFTWMARIVGIGLVVVAALCALRLPFADWLNVGVSALAAAGCAFVAAVWIAYSDGQGYLILLFALVNAMATRSALLALPRRRRG